MRRQMETMRYKVPTQHNHYEVDVIDVLNVIPPRQVDPPTSVNTADEETNEHKNTGQGHTSTTTERRTSD